MQGERRLTVTELRSKLLEAKTKASRATNKLNIQIANEAVRKLEIQLRRALKLGATHDPL